MRSISLSGAVLVSSLIAACGTNVEDTAAATEAQTTAPVLDCTQPGSFPEDAMLGLAGTYESASAPSNAMRALTIGPLHDIAGWAGKNATYTRDMVAPCTDFVAIGDGTGFTKGDPTPLTTSCTGQTGTITTLMDNPALGAFISFEDASGLPFGKDFYFVTSSRVEAGKTTAMCLANGATGEAFLMTRKGP